MSTKLAFAPFGKAVGIAATAAYRFRKLDAAYAGNAVQVRRSSDNTTLDTGFAASADSDTETLLAFEGSQSAYIDNVVRLVWQWGERRTGDSIQAAGNCLGRHLEHDERPPEIDLQRDGNEPDRGQRYPVRHGRDGHGCGADAEQGDRTGAYSSPAEARQTRLLVQFANATSRGIVVFNDAVPESARVVLLPTCQPGEDELRRLRRHAKNFTNGGITTAITMSTRGTTTLTRCHICSRGGTTKWNLGAIFEVGGYYTQPTDTGHQAGEANEKA
ncbi:hypothetical protein [Arthrobacter sp. NicSoilC5]|uniref:hypothetical protein n=1 Tax=Arthrobacter sp. NicSoilC5 TaxID=2831000 RepID=UPI001CC490CA|nr:hypothetical protein [Arthrobacter sp. NicSoilC5]BCW79802.1 hypothetical protein NicSoilC5_18210 [Arthrobacter sp. NicSoilC5]